MHRFFIPPELLSRMGTIALPKDIVHQVHDVLHLVVGEQLVLLDNSGDEVLAQVARSSRTGVEVELLERRAGKRESHVRVILCQGLLKSARFEWILEKGTELGVATFAPILCRRSMVGLEDAGPSKTQRWQRIIREAAEQCGRSRMPELLPIRPLMHALNDIPPGALALMPWEEEHALSLRDCLRIPLSDPTLPVGASAELAERVSIPSRPPPIYRPTGGALDAGTSPTITIVLFIGPEGGLMAEEVKLAQRHNVQVVTLGPRILRAETAALTTVANVMYELE